MDTYTEPGTLHAAKIHAYIHARAHTHTYATRGGHVREYVHTRTHAPHTHAYTHAYTHLVKMYGLNTASATGASEQKVGYFQRIKPKNIILATKSREL